MLSSAAALSDEEQLATSAHPDVLERADVMIECAVGVFPVPLGIAAGFMIDGDAVDIPMATEEPSVIAAASLAGRITARCGGFQTSAFEPVMTVQIFLQNTRDDAEQILRRLSDEIGRRTDDIAASLAARGGGFVCMRVSRLIQTRLTKVEIDIDVRDAMGANKVNSVGEGISGYLEHHTGGRKLMSIVTNAARSSPVEAAVAIPVELLSRAGMSGAEVADRISLASTVAFEDPERAITNNKGIMNGISALVLATGNDTRGVEAAAHGYAARDGAYRSLSRFSRDGNLLSGLLATPVPVGTVGGAIDLYPASRYSLQILGNPGSRRLAQIAVALGLAQNLAALRALVTEGIQHGHMRLHARRLAFAAGARGAEIDRVVTRMASTVDAASARRCLVDIRGDHSPADPS